MPLILIFLIYLKLLIKSYTVFANDLGYSITFKEIGTIKNKCVRIKDHSNISFMPEFLKGKIPTNDDS